MLPTPDALLGTLVRFAALAGLLLPIGAVAMRELVFTRVSAPTLPGALRLLARRAAVVGVAGAVIVIVALFGRLWLQIQEVRAPGTPITAELVQLLVLRTTWGKLWLAQGLAALVAWRAFGMAREDLRVAWIVATVASVGLALTTSFGAHASGTGDLAPLTVAADSVHILSAGAWVGGLATLFSAALWPRGPKNGSVPISDAYRAEDAAIVILVPALVRAFSPMALVAAALLVLTGVAGSLAHLTTPSDIWSTNWGLALMIKLGFVLTTLGIGAFNWRRVTPSLGSPEGDARLRISAWFELTVMSLVLLATAVLIAMPVPEAI